MSGQSTLITVLNVKTETVPAPERSRAPPANREPPPLCVNVVIRRRHNIFYSSSSVPGATEPAIVVVALEEGEAHARASETERVITVNMLNNTSCAGRKLFPAQSELHEDQLLALREDVPAGGGDLVQFLHQVRGAGGVRLLLLLLLLLCPHHRAVAHRRHHLGPLVLQPAAERGRLLLTERRLLLLRLLGERRLTARLLLLIGC